MRALLLLVLTLATIACARVESAEASRPIRVAIYADKGAEEPYIARVQETLTKETQGIACDRIVAADIVAGKLADYDVLVFPGGTGNGLAKSLGPEGSAGVVSFAAGGKGVVGICAGGYLLAKGWNENTSRVDLASAELWDLDHWERGEATIEIDALREGGKTERLKIRFENAPVFSPSPVEGLPAYTPLARYVTDLRAKDGEPGQMAGRDAIIAAPFHKGRVLMFGPHPEFTPGLEGLLVNGVRWAAPARNAREDKRKAAITWESVLEGK